MANHVNLYYRTSLNPKVPSTSIVISNPLSMEQLDGNFKSIDNSFENFDHITTQLANDLATKAPINNPQFAGAVTFPNSSIDPSKDPKDGTVYYNTEQQTLLCYSKGEWQPLSFSNGLSSYVKKTGDIMSGKLIGEDASFKKRLESRPTGLMIEDHDGDDVGTTGVDIVVTRKWFEASQKAAIEKAVGSVEGQVTSPNIESNHIVINGSDNKDSITVNKGNVTVNDGDVVVNNGFLRGNIDLGTL